MLNIVKFAMGSTPISKGCQQVTGHIRMGGGGNVAIVQVAFNDDFVESNGRYFIVDDSLIQKGLITVKMGMMLGCPL